MSLLGILFLLTAFRKEKRRRNGLWSFLLYGRGFIKVVHYLVRVMRTMWLRVSVFSARLFDSHRVMCHGIRVEGGLRVKRLYFLHLYSLSQRSQARPLALGRGELQSSSSLDLTTVVSDLDVKTTE